MVPFMKDAVKPGRVASARRMGVSMTLVEREAKS